MFDFLKKEKHELDDEVDADTEELDIADEEISEDDKSNVSDVDRLLDSLEYTNSYLLQLCMTLGELTKQQTIANALHILDSEYNSADSVMDVEEILQKKYMLFGSIFADYQAKQENIEKNE